MRKACAAIILCAVFFAGCYPIELNTSADGKVIIPRQEGFYEFDASTGKVNLLFKPEGSSPVYALYNPAGKEVLAVVGSSGNAMMGQSQTYHIVTPGSDKTKQIFMGQNGLYAQWSPDGKYVSIAQNANQPVAPMQEGMPQLHLVDIAAGAGKVVVSNIAAHHRWMPDGKGVVVFQALLKDEQNNYTGKLSILNVADGSLKPLVSVMGSEIFFDVSPDGKKILFIAKSAAAGNDKLQVEEQQQDKLFSLDVATGAVKAEKEGVTFVLFSPKGDKVMFDGKGKGGDSLMVAGADFANPVEVADDLAVRIEGMGNNTDIRPGWLGNDTVLYIGRISVYGKDGKNLMLSSVKADGKEKKVLQPALDMAIINGK
ncbi:MAG: hypothetical protein JXR97_15400 [Planctomycetes bacterium]|nr:hypothetical protein [Planctomycetota bacterium]